MISFSSVELFRELENRERASPPDEVARYLRALLIGAGPMLEQSLAQIPVYFRHFTDHSISHSLRIIRNIFLLLEPAQYDAKIAQRSDVRPLTSVDLFLIIAGALVHDLGMVVPESLLDRLKEDPKFIDFVAKWRPDPADGGRSDWVRDGVPRLALAEWVRRSHPTLSKEMFIQDRELCTRLVGGHIPLAEILGQIAEGHGLDFDAVRQFPNRQEIQLPSGLSEECNPRFAALCLRLGDLLDIGTARSCPILRQFSEPLPMVSKDHWDQYRSVTIQNFTSRTEISIVGTCPTQDAERLLRDWVDWLDRESANTVKLLNTEKEERYHLRLGRAVCKVSPQKIGGIPAYEFSSFRFNLDEKLVFERLFGKSLYGRSEVAIRELLQNAIDAQRALLARQLSKQPIWTTSSDAERAKLFRREVLQKADTLPIKIFLETRSDNERWLIVEDNGIGMTREVIEKFLLKVGQSRWSEDPEVQKIGLGNFAIGTFGIGFISALMIGDRIVIQTSSCLPDERGIEATIYGWQRYLATRPYTRARSGTTIAVRLASTDLFPSLEEAVVNLAELLPLPDFPIQLNWNGHEASIPRLSSFWHYSSGGTTEGTQAVYNFDEVGSMVSVLASQGQNKTWANGKGQTQPFIRPPRQVTLCQDGISVGELYPPQGDLPENQVLRRHEVALDLRGDSRIPLNLSRHLPEDTAADFWASHVPRIWNLIVQEYANSRIARTLIRELVEAEMIRPHQKSSLRFVHQKTLLGEVPVDCKSVACIDVGTDESTEAFRQESLPLWLVPPNDLHYLATGARDPWQLEQVTSRGLLRIWSSTEYSLGEFDDNSDGRIKSFNGTLKKGWRNTISSFPFVSKGKTTMCRLNRDAESEGREIRRILGFQLTQQWISIVDPLNLAHSLVPTFMLESLPLEARRRGLALTDYYLWLMSAMFSDQFEEWGDDKSQLGQGLRRAGETLALRVREEDRFSSEISARSRVADDDFDEEYSADGDDDPRLEQPEQLDADKILLEDLRRTGASFSGVGERSMLSDFVAPWENEWWAKSHLP